MSVVNSLPPTDHRRRIQNVIFANRDDVMTMPHILNNVENM